MGGCGDDSGDGDSAGEASSVEVVSNEYSFELPDEITGGLVTLHLVNEGAEPHEYALTRSDEGHTVEELDAAIEAAIEKGGEPPKWVRDVANYGVQTAGASISVTQQLEPGSYELLCFLPGPGRKNHLELGMKRGFTVSGDTGASPPDAAGVITATQEGFDVPAVSSGQQTLKVRNEDAERLGFELVRFNPGKDIADVEKWFEGGLSGGAPAVLYGGAEMAGGESVFFGADFQSGTTYELVSAETQASATLSVD